MVNALVSFMSETRSKDAKSLLDVILDSEHI